MATASSAKAKTESYKLGYQRMRALVWMMAISIVVLTGVFLFVLTNHVPQDRHYAMTAEGQQASLVALDMPNISQQTLFDWSAEAATQIMTFGFNDYETRLTNTRSRFTTKGWESFRSVMINSLFFKTVLEQQQIVTSVPRQSPTMFFEGLTGSVYNWIVEVPLLVTVRSGSLNRTLDLTVRLVVIRVPTAENPTGIAIDRWISF